MHDAEIAIKQGELILRLYELRREPVMRLARSYVGGRSCLIPRKSLFPS